MSLPKQISPREGLIMKAIVEMKAELHKKMDGILNSVRGVDNGMKACEQGLKFIFAHLDLWFSKVTSHTVLLVGNSVLFV